MASAIPRDEQIISADGSLAAFIVHDLENDLDLPSTWAPVKGFIELDTANPDFNPLPVLPDTEYASVNGISADGSVMVGYDAGLAVIWQGNTVVSIAPVISGATFNTSSADYVSADGTVAVGSVSAKVGDAPSFTKVFRWTQNGTVVLPSLSGSTDDHAHAITPDGGTIIGYSYVPQAHAVYWRGTTITDIHPDDSASISYADFVSNDGNVIAVRAYAMSEGQVQAYRWTQEGGLQPLSTAYSSSTWAMSAAGDVLAGHVQFNQGGGIHAFRWTQADGLQDIHPAALLAAPGDSSSVFISRDGTRIFGQAWTTGQYVAFRWTTAGVIDLGNLGFANTHISAITPDGRVAVGQSATSAEMTAGFRWTELGGIQTIKDWLAASGVTLGDDIIIESAEGVSDDGSIVSGHLDDGTVFIAKGDSGLITLADLQQSIAGTAAAISSTRTSAGLVLNGAHGHPMARRTEADRFVAWAGGDYGQDNHGERDGHLSVAEGGGGYNFGPAQLNVALGRTDSLQNTVFDGETDHTGVFGIVDVIIPVPATPLFVTVTGIYQDSELDIRRGYLNGGLPDRSDGDTDAATYGGALRVDWLNACSIGGVDLTPFTKLVITRSKIDAFTETGGGFPAAYQTQRDTVSDLHLGTNASYELRKNLRLIATLEGVYRFQDHASSTGVSIPGVTPGVTSLAGEDYKQAWLSGGLGTEYDVGAGTFSIMLNGTTEGAASNLWLATSYQYKF